MTCVESSSTKISALLSTLNAHSELQPYRPYSENTYLSYFLQASIQQYSKRRGPARVRHALLYAGVGYFKHQRTKRSKYDKNSCIRWPPSSNVRSACVLGRKNPATESAGIESAARFRRTYTSHCFRIAAVEIFPASSAIRWVAVIRSHLAPRLMPPGSRGTATSTVPLFFALRPPISSPSLFYSLLILPGLTFCPPPTFNLDANMFDS